LVGGQTVGDFVEDARLDLVLLQGDGLLLDVEAFIDSTLPEDILLDGPIDMEGLEGGLVGGAPWFPLWGWDDLQ
jgi:hypothetical protein